MARAAAPAGVSLVTLLEGELSRAKVVSDAQRLLVERVAREVPGHGYLTTLLARDPLQAVGIAVAAAPEQMRDAAWGGAWRADERSKRDYAHWQRASLPELQGLTPSLRVGEHRDALMREVKPLMAASEEDGRVSYRVVHQASEEERRAEGDASNRVAKYLEYTVGTPRGWSWMSVLGDSQLLLLQDMARQWMEERQFVEDAARFNVSDDDSTSLVLERARLLFSLNGESGLREEEKLAWYAELVVELARTHLRRLGAMARQRSEKKPEIYFPTRTRFDERHERRTDRW